MRKGEYFSVVYVQMEVTQMSYNSVRKCIQIEIERRFNLICEKVWTGDTVSNICNKYGTSREAYSK